MRLTTAPGTALNQGSGNLPIWTLWAIIGATGVTFTLDCFTVNAPVQHLYYIPIILAARQFGRLGGIVMAASAVILYHLAKIPSDVHYGESDLIQIVLFFAIGLITAKLAADAQRLHRLAMTDDLTGLHNLRSFEANLKSLLVSSRATGSKLSMFVLDVDRLKQLNDAHGHLAGADAVRTVGHILAGELPPNALACRYGGDEFVIAIPHCGSVRAEQIAEDLRFAVNSATPLLAGKNWGAGTLSISIGVVCGEVSDDSAEKEGTRLFHAADQALYQAKAAGRNRVHCVLATYPELSAENPR